MKTRLLTLLALAALLSPRPCAAQIGQTATLTGTIADASGGVLPGVTVTVTSDALIGGTRTAVTDENGVYRFPAIPPGTYTVKVELAGFRTVTQEARLQLGQTITVDAKLQPGLTDTIEVTGSAPAVDVKSSAAQKNLSEEILEFIPYSSRFGPDAIMLSPGVNPNSLSSFGSGAESSNSYMIDGVDVSDPEGGTQWLFANYNWFQEVQVIGLGAPAEYGGFTGVASNSLFRSGGNRFSGLFETLFQNDSFSGDNTSSELLEQNPALTPGSIDYNTDTTFQIGGPIKQDRAWFFTSFQYYRPKTAPAGFPPPDTEADNGPRARLESSPRFLFKPTMRIGQADQLTGFFEADKYTVDGRFADSNVSPAATLHQASPEVAWNANYTKVLSPSSVFDIKYSGFWGYYYLSPYNGTDTMGWVDVGTDFYSVNSYYFYNADRVRHQANSSLTKYASGFAGEHNLKFGAEIERSYVKSELGYPGGGYILADHGVPYYAYFGGGYLQDDINTRFSLFAQDSWSVGQNLTLNLGLRMDHNRGFVKSLDDTVFTTTSWGPRVGFAYDIQGNGRTVIRGHYGRFFDGAKSTYYNLLDGTIPQFGASIDPVTLAQLHEPYQLTPGGTAATVDEDIKQPRMDQVIFGFEHELFRNFAVGANFIYRKNTNFVDDVLINGEFTSFELPDPGPDGVEGTSDDPGTFLTVFDQTSDPADNRYLITNPDDAFRRYRGVELSATKRFADRWMLQASWVISKLTGNINNDDSYGNSEAYDEPNLDPRFQPFIEGRPEHDNTHIAKVLGAYQLPWNLMASGAFFYTTGDTFTRTVRVTGLGQGRSDMFAEPRGSGRLDGQPRFDMKLEKTFQLGYGRVGVTFEGFNIFNNGAIDDVFPRVGDIFLQPQSLVSPRQWRIGGVFRF